MNSRKIVITLMVLAVISMASILVSTPKALAQGRIFITPLAIDDVSIGPGSQVTYNASAADVADVFTWQVQLTFDPAILSCTGASVVPGSIFNFEIDVNAVIDNFAGTVTLGSTQLLGAPVSGSGVLATFNYTVVGRGYSHVNFSRPLGADTYLLDPLGHDIPVTMEDAYFNNYAPPPPATVFVEPAKVVNPTLTPGSSFDVNLSIASATDLHQWTADVFFNNTILNATAAVEGNFLKSGGTTTFTSTISNSYNATHGQVHMTGALTTGSISGNGDLTNITFETLDLGDTPIAISNVDLRDPSNTNLPFTTTNGFFSNVGVRDAAVTGISVYNWVIAKGQTLNVTVKVENHGDFTETFNVTIYADSTIAAPSQQVENLPPEGQAELLFLWNTGTFAIGNYTLKAVADTIPGEGVTADNTLVYGIIAVIFPGDVNQDGKVNMRDFAAIAMAYNGHPGLPKWNPYADMNADGRVELRDLAIAAVNFTGPE